MAINSDDAFDVNENGVAITDDNGNVVGYFAVGTGDPTGTTAPQNTWYFRQDGQKIWYNFSGDPSDWRQIHAEDIIATDNTQAPPVQNTLQAVLDSLTGGDTPAVSQTLIFGDGGNTSQNSWLPNQGVVSSVVGIPVGLTNPKIRSVFLGNQNIRTGNVIIRERSPAGTGTFTDVYTLALSSQSFANVTGLDVAITQNAEVGVFTEVSLKNCKIVVNINGDSA